MMLYFVTCLKEQRIRALQFALLGMAGELDDLFAGFVADESVRFEWSKGR